MSLAVDSNQLHYNLNDQAQADSQQHVIHMKAVGDSMIEAGIYPDDILVIDPRVEPRSGYIVAVKLNGEMTLKRLSYHFGKIHLIPENSKYKIVAVKDTDSFEIVGVLTHSIHSQVVSHLRPKRKNLG